jgi:hypothetical protein
MNAFKFIYGLIHPLGVVARFTLWGGGSGGGGSQNSTNTTYQTNIPEYAKPYVETMLGATQKQLFQGNPTEGGGFDITGFQPYRAYGGTYDASGNQTSYDPGKAIAGFQPMQTAAQQGIANMQTPQQYGQAMNLTGQGIMGQLGTAGQGVGLAGMGYEAANAGNQYAQQATNPYATQAYMSPYMQNVVDVQQREAQRQADIATTGRNAQAVQAGAFGGSRQAITDAEAARNLATQQGAIQAQGSQNAFQNAQQAQQYGAGLGLQGMQAGMQGVGAGIGAQQAGYGQAMSGAQNLANLGQQQLGAQQGIYSLQNTTGAQQQALEQQKINQAVQDYSNAQQYPLMQLGTMSNMIRGLPMQAQTTQQYVAAPNPVTQAIGAAGAGASLYNAFGGGKAEGGVIKGYAKGGIMSYAEGGGTDALDKASKMAAIANMMPRIGFSAGGISNDIEHDLYSMDEDDLQRQLKESSSPSVKRMAQRILRMKQMENQPQQPSMAGGGIIAFEKGGGAKLKPEDVVGPEDNSQARQAAGILLAPRDSGAVSRNPVTPDIDASGVMPKLPEPKEAAVAKANNVQPAKQPPNSLEAAMSDPNIPDVMKGQLADIQTKYARTTDDIIKEKRAAYEAAGVSPRNPEERANLMKERANADDEAKRNRYLQAAAFFARWGSTPGSTLAAGLTAVRERVPEIIESEKEAKKIRMEINKSIASLDEATRLENKGEVDAATAIKEKDAEKMQAVYFKLSDIEMAAKKEEAHLKRQREADAAREQREDARYTMQTSSNERIHAAQNATHLAVAEMNNKAEQARIAATTAERKDQAKWHDYQRMTKSAADELSKLDALRSADDYKKSKEYITKAEALRDISADKTIPPMYQSGYEKAVANINRVEQDIQTRRGRIDRQMKEYETRTFGKPFEFNTDTTPANRPQVKGSASRGGESRPSLNDPSLQK